MKKILGFLVGLVLAASSLATVTTVPTRTGIGGNVDGTDITPSSVSTGAITATSIVSPGIRIQLTTDKTLYVRTPALPVTFSSGSANIGWLSHGLSVNDPVVLSVLPNMGVTTVTLASPGVFSKTAHGYVAGQPLRFDTTGALPTGLTAGTTYYVIAAGLTADTFEVSASVGGAAVNTSGSQSGTHYVSQVGAMPTFSTAGLLAPGTPYYVASVPSANSITLSLTPSGTALGTATLATGTPIYSASTGSDSNDGSAADRAHARLTLNETAEYAFKNYDLGGDVDLALTIQLADSVYAPAYVAEMLGWTINSGGRPNARILGNASYPSNVMIALGGSDIYGFYGHGQWDIDGIGIDVSTGSDGACGVSVFADAYLYINSMYLKGRATQGAYCPYDQTQLYFAYSDVSSATNTIYAIGAWQQFLYNNSAKINFFSGALTLLNTPSGSDSFNFQYGGQTVISTTIAGSWSGPKMDLQLGAQLETYGTGVTAIPGSTNGTVQPGSSFDGNLGATSTNDAALAGTNGEYQRLCVDVPSGLSLSNGTTAVIATLTFTAGEVDFEGNATFSDTTATVTGGQAAIAASSTMPTDGSQVYDGTVTTLLSDTSSVTIPRTRISSNSTITAYLLVNKSFSAGTVKGSGCLTGRRPR